MKVGYRKHIKERENGKWKEVLENPVINPRISIIAA